MISLLKVFKKNATFFYVALSDSNYFEKALGDFIHFYENATFFTRPSLICWSQEAQQICNWEKSSDELFSSEAQLLMKKAHFFSKSGTVAKAI